jgi:hypothetical protein
MSAGGWTHEDTGYAADQEGREQRQRGRGPRRGEPGSRRLLQADVQRDKRRPCHGLRRQPHYKGLFAIFPFSTFLLSFLGLFNATDLVNTMVDKLSGVTPQSVTKFIEGQLLSITQSQAESAFTFGAIISILLALWGVPLGNGGYERHVRGRGR